MPNISMESTPKEMTSFFSSNAVFGPSDIDENIDPIDYLNSNVWVRLGITKYGVGAIALRNIPKNTKITDYDPYKSVGGLSIKIFL